jgi:hypothetical protein
MVPFGPYAPDVLGADGGPALQIANNVIPTARGYAPLPSLSDFSAQLVGACRGAFSGLDLDGDPFVISGTATKLYILRTGGLDDVTRIALGYTVGTTGHWEFAQMGNVVIAVNGTDKTQYFDLGTSANFADVTGAPIAAHVATIRNQIHLANIIDPIDGTVEFRIRWSAFGDPLGWPAVGSDQAIFDQSDQQDLPAGGPIVAIKPAREIGIIIQQRDVMRLDYVGGDLIYSISTISQGKSLNIGETAVQQDDAVYFLSEDGWCMTEGSTLSYIGDETVDKSVLSLFDFDNPHLASACVDPEKKIVMWCLPKHDELGVTKLVIYHRTLRRWSTGDETIEWLVSALPNGVQMDDYPSPWNLDESPPPPDAPFDVPSLDSASLRGFPWKLGGFDNAHRLGVFSGTPKPATLETMGFQLFPSRRAFINKIRIVADTQNATLQIGYRARAFDPLTYSQTSTPGVDGACSIRNSSRYQQVKVTLNNWTYAHGLDFDARVEGTR